MVELQFECKGGYSRGIALFSGPYMQKAPFLGLRASACGFASAPHTTRESAHTMQEQPGWLVDEQHVSSPL